MSDAPRLCSECRWIRVIPGERRRIRTLHTSGVDLAPSARSDLRQSAPAVRALVPLRAEENWLLVPDPCGPEGKHWEPP